MDALPFQSEFRLGADTVKVLAIQPRTLRAEVVMPDGTRTEGRICELARELGAKGEFLRKLTVSFHGRINRNDQFRDAFLATLNGKQTTVVRSQIDGGHFSRCGCGSLIEVHRKLALPDATQCIACANGRR